MTDDFDHWVDEQLSIPFGNAEFDAWVDEMPSDDISMSQMAVIRRRTFITFIQ